MQEITDGALWVVMIILLIALIGTPYGTYRLGRKLERRDLTQALIQEMSKMEDVYMQGYSDGEHRCNGAVQ